MGMFKQKLVWSLLIGTALLLASCGQNAGQTTNGADRASSGGRTTQGSGGASAQEAGTQVAGNPGRNSTATSRTGSGAPTAGAPVNGAPTGAGGGRRQMAVPVQATVVKEGTLTVDRSTAGVVTPVVQSQVAAQVAGVVKKVYLTAGDWVKAGQIVVQLDDAQLKLSLANAQASLENAKINLKIGQDNATQANPKLALQVQSAQSALDSAQKFYDSQKALYDLGGISASALDTAASQLSAAKANLEGAKSALDQNNKSDDQTIAQLKLAVQQAQNQVAQAELNLQNASIRAPFEGQIASINMQAGMYVGLNTPVFSLVSRESQVNFSISPSDSPYLYRGSTVLFIVNGQGIPVKVSQAPSVPLNGVVPLTASLPPSVSLPFGAVGNVSYTVPVAKGIIVPLMALQTLENRTFVFKIVEGKVAISYVTITGEAGTNAVVTGLSNGDTVAVSPPPGLIQGSPVQAIMMGSDQSGTNPGAGAPTAGKK